MTAYCTQTIAHNRTRLHLLQNNIGIDDKVVTGVPRKLERVLVAFRIERRAAPDVVSEVMLSYDLQDLAFLGFLDERPALKHASCC